MHRSAAPSLALAAALSAIVATAAAPAAHKSASAPHSPGRSYDGLDATAIDPAVGMCQNFYRHACGGFIARTPVDDLTPSVTLAESRFNANLQGKMTEVLEPSGPAATPDAQRLAIFYRSCRASAAADTDGDLALIQQWLTRIDAVETRAGLAPVMRDLAAIGVEPFVTYGGRPDPKRSDRYRGEMQNTRLWADRAAIERAFVISGEPAEAAARDARNVSDLLGRVGREAIHRYDFARNQHPMPADALKDLAPQLDWAEYFSAVGIDPKQTINVTSPDYLRAVNRELAQTDLATLKAYLRWDFLFSLRGELPSRYYPAFMDAPLPDRPSINPTERCRDATVRALGIEFSRELSRLALTPQSRREAQSLAESIRAAAIRVVSATPWLSPDGRSATARKLATTDLKIGYPDRWPTTGAFRLKADAFLANVLASRQFEQAREWRRVKAPRSRFDWEFKVDPWVGEGMAASRLALPNGYPDAFTNSLIMTAAFLLPPRFDPRVPIEVNYGTFGAVFGHELVHVAQTHEFDAQGLMADLWGAVDVAAAGKAGQCLVDEAKAYGAAEGLELDPKAQLDENMADFGGLRLAYSALAPRRGAQMSRPDAKGMTPAKRFFYAYAQNWCVAETDKHRRSGAASDGHGPSEFRVNAALSNLPAFRAATAR